MSEFKGGEDVLFDGSEYVYIAKHPIFPDFSVIQAKDHIMLIGDLIYTGTDHIKKKPKTHTVNGFEVPEPVYGEEYEKLRHNQGFFCFDANCPNGRKHMVSSNIMDVAVKCGFVFRSESDIKKNIAALQGIDPSTVE